MFCSQCGAQMRDDDKFCKHCGASAKNDVVFCAQCGSPMAKGTRFCSACGAEAVTPVAAAQPIVIAPVVQPLYAPQTAYVPAPSYAAVSPLSGDQRMQKFFRHPLMIVLGAFLSLVALMTLVNFVFVMEWYTNFSFLFQRIIVEAAGYILQIATLILCTVGVWRGVGGRSLQTIRSGCTLIQIGCWLYAPPALFAFLLQAYQWLAWGFTNWDVKLNCQCSLAVFVMCLTLIWLLATAKQNLAAVQAGAERKRVRTAGIAAAVVVFIGVYFDVKRLVVFNMMDVHYVGLTLPLWLLDIVIKVLIGVIAIRHYRMTAALKKQAVFGG